MLDINLEFIRGILFIRLEGVLDNNTYTKLSDCLDDMINNKKLKYFVLNLEELDIIDEEGMNTIIDRYFDICLNDGKLVICGYKNQYRSDFILEDIFSMIEHSNNELGAFKLINI